MNAREIEARFAEVLEVNRTWYGFLKPTK